MSYPRPPARTRPGLAVGLVVGLILAVIAAVAISGAIVGFLGMLVLGAFGVNVGFLPCWGAAVVLNMLLGGRTASVNR